VLQTTDIIVRTERWSKLREQLDTYVVMGAAPPGYSNDMPWDTVIAQSAYCTDSLNAGWWRTHFELPCTLAASPGGASNMIREVEGYPCSSSQAPGASSSQSGAAAPKAPQPKQNRSANSSEVCSNYNTKAGRCKGDAPCVSGRRHVCDVCGEPHRRVDFHPTGGAKRDWNRVSGGWKNKKENKKQR